MSISHTEFHAAAQQATALVDAERDAAFAEAARLRADAADKHATLAAALKQKHDDENQARIIAFQHSAAEQFASVVRAARNDPSRPNIAAVIAKFAEVDAEGQREIGRGVYSELWHTVADAIAEAVPGAYIGLSNEGRHDRIVQANQSLLDALRRANNVAAVQYALAELEREIETVAAGNSVGDAARAKERWQIITRGSFDRKVAALKAFDKRCFDEDNGDDAARAARHGQWEQATKTRQLGESMFDALRRVTTAAASLLGPKRPTPPAPTPIGP